MLISSLPPFIHFSPVRTVCLTEGATPEGEAEGLISDGQWACCAIFLNEGFKNIDGYVEHTAQCTQ